MDGLFVSNALARGFYTVSEAARLIEVGNAHRILGWLRGYEHRQIGPLLHRDYQPIGKQEELSFLDLMEVRFVEHFREQGVKVRTLRRALENARVLFKSDKPLATSKIRFIARDDKKDVFVEEVLGPAAKATDDTRLWSLLTKQFEIYQLIRQRIVHGVAFDPRTEFAARWAPRPSQFPEIVIDPLVAYGQPAGPSKVPTRVLYENWLAEGEDASAVSEWYAVPSIEVARAIEFENLISVRQVRTSQ